MKPSAETAAAAINDTGGVNGRKIKIVVEDDACDPKQAVAIKYVDGHACSGSSIPVSDVYADNSILMMSPRRRIRPPDGVEVCHAGGAA